MLCLSSSNPVLVLNLKPPPTQHAPFSSSSPLLRVNLKNPNKKKFRKIVCRAELSQDAPFVAAIGACMLSSLVLAAAPGSTEDDDRGGGMNDSTDTRFAVMGIVSFIPYFNWLSWVFAWLDTGKRQYAVYALVYLAPYLRSNMSLSLEDTWVPIASIIMGIIHVQLEASIRNGDIQGFQFFNETAKHLNQSRNDKDIHLKRHEKSSKKGKRARGNLPKEQSRNDNRDWGVPRDPQKDQEELNGDWDEDESRKH